MSVFGHNWRWDAEVNVGWGRKPVDTMESNVDSLFARGEYDVALIGRIFVTGVP